MAAFLSAPSPSIFWTIPLPNLVCSTSIPSNRVIFSKDTSVKLDLGTAQGYASVKVTNGTYVSKNNDKLRNLTFDLLFTHANQRQKG